MILIYLFSGLLTYIIGYFVIPILRKYILDKPNKRSSHKISTPTSGGILFVLPICFLSIFINDFSPLICIPLAIVGLIDDIFNLNSIFRYFSQLTTLIIILVNSNIFINYLNNQNIIFISFIVILFCFIGTAIINFINFMDGLDGMVAGTMFSLFFILSLNNNEYNYAILSGCLAGFLIFNWSPAKIFMGDIGSTFIAGIYVIKLFDQMSLSNIIFLLIPLCPFWFDCIICLIRRLLLKQNIFKPHKLHLYQRLNQSGWSHSKVSTVYIVTTSFLALMCMFNSLLISIISAIFILVFGYYLDKKFALPFKLT